MTATRTAEGRPLLRCDGAAIFDGDAAVGAVTDANLLTDGPDDVLAPATAGCPLLLAWSGSHTESLDEETPRNWMGGAVESLAGAIDRLLPMLEARSIRLLVRTHHRHILNDHRSVLAFMGVGPRALEARVGLALDIESLLAPSMTAASEEHILRFLESLGPLASVVVARSHKDSHFLSRWSSALQEHVAPTVPLLLVADAR